jgi:hypothetical protein
MSQKVNASYSRVSQNQSGAADESGFFSGRSGIFATVPSKRENSSSLKITFILTIFLFIMELIIAFNKTSFFNLMVYIAIFAVVLVGYFDKYYMRFIIFCLILSIVLDFIWIIVLAPVSIVLFSINGIPHLLPHTQPSKLPSLGSNTHSSLFSWSPRYILIDLGCFGCIILQIQE